VIDTHPPAQGPPFYLTVQLAKLVISFLGSPRGLYPGRGVGGQLREPGL